LASTGTETFLLPAGTIEIHQLAAKRSSVISAQARIQSASACRRLKNLASRFRGNDGKGEVDFEPPPPDSLGFKQRVLQWLLCLNGLLRL
jgi:hypothetical protein